MIRIFCPARIPSDILLFWQDQADLRRRGLSESAVEDEALE
jgi:hypothetical protein